MKRETAWPALAVLLLLAGAPGAQDDNLRLHDDYYLGFSQGAFYGLMLAGVEYDVAWCVKGELDYEADELGAGSEFQSNIERIYRDCAGQQ